MYDVIALGELLVDLAERSKDEAGYPTLAANPGGAPGNFLAALSAYGKKTAFLAKVGDDTFGRLLVGTMQRAGIDGCGIRIDPDTFTTLAFVTFDAHGDRSFAFARKPGADTQLRWDEIDPAMLDETHVFHFGSLSCTDEPARSATQSAVAYARAHGKLVTYDPNYRPPLWKTEQEAKEQILWGLRQADLVKISDEEVQFLWGCSPEQGAEGVLPQERAGRIPLRLPAGPHGRHDRRGRHLRRQRGLPLPGARQDAGAADAGGSGLHGPLCLRRGEPLDRKVRRDPVHPGKRSRPAENAGSILKQQSLPMPQHGQALHNIRLPWKGSLCLLRRGAQNRLRCASSSTGGSGWASRASRSLSP